MLNESDYLLIEDAMSMTSKAPMKQIYSCVVCTNDYFFVVPTKSVGMYIIFDSIKNHSFFDGLSVLEGLKKLTKEAENVQALESQLIELLENDPKYVYKLSEAASNKIKGFLGKKTFMYRRPTKTSWGSFSPKSKAEGKALAAFYEGKLN